MDISKNHLSEEQIKVTQFCGTEPPFSGELLNEKREGTYSCVVCGGVLFDSNTKYDSGSGWPSFDRGIEENLEYDVDYKIGYPRSELKCNNCGGHLGHMFNDGPKKTTGKRHCINSAALNFIPANEKP